MEATGIMANRVRTPAFGRLVNTYSYNTHSQSATQLHKIDSCEHPVDRMFKSDDETIDGSVTPDSRRKQKRQRRRSTVKMTAYQTHEVHSSTSIMATGKPQSESTCSASTDNQPSDKTKNSKQKHVSCVNIFVVARAVHRVGARGEMIKAEKPPCDQCVNVPHSADHLQHEILHSAMAISSGCCDRHGCLVVIVFCKHGGWDAPNFATSELARLLLYYNTLPRESSQGKGLTVVVDARGTTLSVLNALLETIYTVEASSTGSIAIVHVLADRIAQSLLFRSPVFRPQVNIKIDLLTSIEALYRFVDREHLPPLMGGTLEHRHNHWVSFRLELEPFVNRCRNVAQSLLSVLQDIAQLDNLPQTVDEAHKFIEQHEHCVQHAFNNPMLAEVQGEAEEVLHRLRDMGEKLQYCHDYKCAMDGAEQLFTQVQDATYKLAKLADERLHRLEQSLQLRQFEMESSKVIEWLVTEGEELLSHHQDVCDNLKGIKAQQKDFDKLYFSAMTHIEKGNDMLEEAGMLSQSGNFDQVTGIKEISRELKSRLRHFTARLDELKDKIENTAKCYHLLDRSYEWALEAMKHVAGMKMDSSCSPDEVERLMASLSLYLQEHPPIAEQTFEIMMELSDMAQNDKLQEQCKVAKSRCQETAHLLKVRQVTLHRAMEQLENEEERRRSSFSVNSGQSYYPSIEDNEPIWQPQTSTPLGLPNLSVRRRSYAGKPSAPLYSPAVAAFRNTVKETNLSEFEEYLFNEGLITEDMSDRIVTCLPKGLSDSTLRSSRESLRGSRESLRGSMEHLDRDEKSSSVPKEMASSVPCDCGSSLMEANLCSSLVSNIGKHNKPHKKMMRKTVSVLTGSEGEILEGRDTSHGRATKTLSMITGSSESLPSLAEEEEVQCGSAPVNIESDRKFVWTPVPVNTHLQSRSSRAGLQSYHSMSDLRLTDEQIKKRRTLAMIMSEMIQTERDYVKSLQFVIDNYLPELLRDDVPQALRGKRNVVFGNVEQIHQFHSQYFLKALERCENSPFRVARIFLKHASEFYLYALYNKNKPKSDVLMMEFGARFFREKQVNLGDRMDLSSYLLKPVQRMGKYALLLKQIYKECPESEQQDYADLASALEMVKFQLRHGNDLLAMDSIRDCDVNLQEQGRLMRQEEFLVWQGRRKCMRRIFLFEDLILFSKTKRSSSGHDVYTYKGSIKTSDMGLTENLGDSPFRKTKSLVGKSNYKTQEITDYGFEIWFRKRTAGEAYVLQAPTIDVKNTWVMEISRLLWKQAIMNRENRLTEMARMGIGNKPCLDIKPSKNNINDRFVNIHNRIPRSRNSIAVSSIDHLKNGNKRPHSIISVSSASSSNSSHSSGFGAMTLPGLESMPEDAIPASASTLTVCSNESGISLNSSSSPSMVDGYTQTTLKKGVHRSDSGISSDYTLSLTTEPSDSNLLSTDV